MYETETDSKFESLPRFPGALYEVKGLKTSPTEILVLFITLAMIYEYKVEFLHNCYLISALQVIELQRKLVQAGGNEDCRFYLRRTSSQRTPFTLTTLVTSTIEAVGFILVVDRLMDERNLRRRREQRRLRDNGLIIVEVSAHPRENAKLSFRLRR